MAWDDDVGIQGLHHPHRREHVGDLDEWSDVVDRSGKRYGCREEHPLVWKPHRGVRLAVNAAHVYQFEGPFPES